MISKVKNLINILNTNKPIIEVINSLVLSTVVIVTSVRSCQMYERQAKAAEVQIRPSITVRHSYDYNEKNRDIETDSLIISNTRGDVLNIDSTAISFIRYEITKGRNVTNYFLPIIYYGISAHTGNSKGDLIKHFDLNNHLLFGILYRTEVLQHPKDLFTKLELYTYLKLNYVDESREKNEIFFLIRPGEIIPVKEEDFVSCKEYLNNLTFPQHISKLNYLMLVSDISSGILKPDNEKECKFDRRN
ncbi:hypothetical protein [Leptospira sarikeiensis]|uniref:Uncharacterized protein n=1 Tax=Leptospira sarikeiensis TaxID=2484943 RepID=A0A4R9K8W8_9LEPT|nr:hypothetical protein [Leptospira sarikeiensis]TGL61158.1 hypothetical protein EHQ64_11095 [Leptospira sarikeiensis]